VVGSYGLDNDAVTVDPYEGEYMCMIGFEDDTKSFSLNLVTQTSENMNFLSFAYNF